MKGIFTRILKSLLYRASDIEYAIFPKKAVLRLYCNLTNVLRGITWKMACRYYGPEMTRYRGDIPGFILSEIEKGDRVIDIGCAEGNLTSLAAEKARSVVGIDIDEGYIEKIDEKKRSLENVRFMAGNFLDMDFKETFDVAILVHTIEHLPDSGKALKKLAGLCRKVLIETPNPDSDWLMKILDDLGVKELGDDKHFELFNSETLREALSNNGWGEITISKGDGVVRAVARSLSVKDKR